MNDGDKVMRRLLREYEALAQYTPRAVISSCQRITVEVLRAEGPRFVAWMHALFEALERQAAQRDHHGSHTRQACDHPPPRGTLRLDAQATLSMHNRRW